MAIMADIPDNVLFRVFSNRIHLTNLMPWINDVNSKDANDQLNFVLADEDWRQWKVSLKICKIQVLSFKANVCHPVVKSNVWDRTNCQNIQYDLIAPKL